MLQGIGRKFQQIQVIVGIGGIDRTAGGNGAVIFFAVKLLLPAELIPDIVEYLQRFPFFSIQYDNTELIPVKTVDIGIRRKHL